ncbi:hypothetical protein KW791_03645, partial [Candidatus Parcubacteria bacterium]|nr:hypothetical protein [Candidatus Parcubacteria bacterium]
WEGQLIRGGMSGGSGTIGAQPFDFTIESDAMAEKAQEYMTNQTEVVIKYRMEGLYSVCRSDSSGHFLTSIEPAKKPAGELSSVQKGLASRKRRDASTSVRGFFVSQNYCRLEPSSFYVKTLSAEILCIPTQSLALAS